SRSMSTRKQVTSTIWSKRAPAASTTRRTFSMVARVWAATSYGRGRPSASRTGPPGMAFVPAWRGPMPLTNRKSPTRRACGYGPTGTGAASVRMEPSMGFLRGSALRTELDADVLVFRVEAQAVIAALAPDARVLDPAEGY